MQEDQTRLSSLKGILNFGYRVKYRSYKPCENTIETWKDKKVNGMAVLVEWEGNIYDLL